MAIYISSSAYARETLNSCSGERSWGWTHQLCESPTPRTE